MQTQTSSALHNPIMEAGGKDRPPILAPDNYVQWKSRIKRYIDTKPNYELIHFCLKNPPYQYKFLTTNVNATPVTSGNEDTSQPQQPRRELMETFASVPEDIKKWIIAEAEAVQIILTGIDNDIYSTVDVCPNAMKMWKAIERLKQEWQRFMTIVKQSQQQQVYHPQTHPTHYTQSPSTRSQATTRNRGKAIANSPPPTYDPEPEVVVDDDASSKEKEIDKIMALISMYFKKIYKPTNNNLQTSSNTRNLNFDNTPRSSKGTGCDRQTGHCKEFGHVARECQKPKQAKDFAYHKENMLMCKQEEAGIQLSTEQVDWRDDKDDEPEDQELEAHYMLMAKIQEVTPDAADDFGPIFDAKPLQKIHNSDDDYYVFTNEKQHHEQPEFVNDTYFIEQGDTNITHDPSDMSNNGEEADQDDQMLQKECELLTSLIEQMKIKN
ncbi:hypothetical protein Tco_0673893 [Tanacetum coccineum]